MRDGSAALRLSTTGFPTLKRKLVIKEDIKHADSIRRLTHHLFSSIDTRRFPPFIHTMNIYHGFSRGVQL